MKYLEKTKIKINYDNFDQKTVLFYIVMHFYMIFNIRINKIWNFFQKRKKNSYFIKFFLIIIFLFLEFSHHEQINSE